MFSQGQKIFALIFIISFLVILTFQFLKDRKRNKNLFKGTYWVLIAIMALMLGYLLLTKLIH
ncbi:MAG: hypothetical protein CMD31_00585 [Flavobacteriales bacterium]|jgi:uncharacterized membrane protein YbhN (UPF0104 family)|nr:hypothetical protein [Flavobacteriales bacterium]